ncbi:NAD-P-binding protein [Laetiporus sulphureus 93-53]|uniref:NAD-P-binding protein n=1 Tax=Laetiporus sulphureus 93-53 TaxID=1314785 RepID=A0A165G0P5_9APHY|nr:NAD-P-binding protein [Laetiporus sulphureus 93-53]KZT09674.1 NAD-P-binding protein [Laetiporus sulphureus 93-53]
MTAPASFPKSIKALILRQSPQDRKPLYHDVVLEEKALPPLQKGLLLVKIGAAGFNHRDVWIRKGLYPGIAIGSVMGGDGAGTVVASGDDNDPLLNKRVFLVPSRGWEQHPDAPESDFSIMGGSAKIPIGAFSQYVAIESDQVILTPNHLDDIHAAALPIGAVTAWRATMVNARVQKGDNVLITGIGGGVALMAMQLCIAKGANVYVTSSSEEKIHRAISLGAKGGVNYKAKDWPVQLERMLQKQNSSKVIGGSSTGSFDAVIDAAGGDIMPKVGKVLKPGGRVVAYGMHAYPSVTFTMREILKNQQFIGSTMGSHKDLIDATNFIAKHRIVPIVSNVIDGLEAAEDGFELIRRGEQFGKVVINIGDESQERAKL